MSTCALCTAEPASAQLEVRLNPDDRVAFPARVAACDECRRLLIDERDDELAARLSPDYDDYGGASLIPLLRSRLVDVHPRPFDETVAQHPGFERLSAHTGAVEEVGAIWPPAHRVAVDEADDPWLVRSPWPDQGVGDVVDALIDVMEHQELWMLDDGWQRASTVIFVRR